MALPYLMMQVMTLTCNVVVVNKLRQTKGRFIREKDVSRLQFNGAQNRYLWDLRFVFVFLELSQGHKHYLFASLVGVQVKI